MIETPSSETQVSEPEPIEITEAPKEFFEQPVKPRSVPKNQIAETEQTDNSKEDPNAKYLGERTQTAEQQMRAKTVDDFRKGTGSGFQEGNAQNTTATGEESAQSLESNPLDVDIGSEQKSATTGTKKSWQSLSLHDLSVGTGGAESASDDNLEGVAEGNRTILSTKEFKYYSYYHRIKELLRQHWKPQVESRLVKIWARGGRVPSSEMITRLLILLNEKGEIQKITRVAGSGVTDIDSAAEEAFQMAAPFPNPPTGMVDTDGFVRIRWDFVLRTDGAPSIQWRRVSRRPGDVR